MVGLKDILDKMTSTEPSARPTMSEALGMLNTYREGLSEEALASFVREDDGFPRGPDGELIKSDGQTDDHTRQDEKSA